jgi:hypothetical protein
MGDVQMMKQAPRAMRRKYLFCYCRQHFLKENAKAPPALSYDRTAYSRLNTERKLERGLALRTALFKSTALKVYVAVGSSCRRPEEKDRTEYSLSSPSLLAYASCPQPMRCSHSRSHDPVKLPAACLTRAVRQNSSIMAQIAPQNLP